MIRRCIFHGSSCVFLQLVTFGNDRYRFATFLKQNTVAFRHLLLEDWNDPDIPPQVYPNTGLYAVYIQEDFYKRIDFAVNNFIDIRDIAVGTYQPEAINGSLHFRFCKREFMQAHIFPQNHSFIYDSGIEETCLLISLAPYEIEKFSIRNYLDQHNASVGFDRMVDAHVLFKVKSVALNSMDPDDEPACYIFDISVRPVLTSRDSVRQSFTFGTTKLARPKISKFYECGHLLHNDAEKSCKMLIPWERYSQI